MNYELRTKRLFILLLVVFEIGSIGIIPRPAMAETIDLSLSPSITEIVGTPGSRLSAPITITNHAKTKQKVTFSFVPFLSQGDEGSVTLGEATAGASMFSLAKDGDSLPDTFELRPNETAALTLIISIPKDAKPQDYYETLLFQTENEKTLTQTSSKLAIAIATNILLSVYGENELSTLQARIEEFSTRLIFSGEPLAFTTRVENFTDYFFKASGEIRILDVNGHEVYRSRLEEVNVLAHTRRLLKEKASLSSKGLFGKYNALVRVDIGKRETLTDSFTFYVIPKDKTMLTAFGLLIILVVIGRLHLYSKIRQRAH